MSMDMIMNIIQSAIGIVVTGLVTFLVSKLTQMINAKIGDKKAANFLIKVTTLVGDSVKTVYQTYVESLKNQDIFTEEAQKEALDKCLTIIKSQLTPELIDYIKTNFGDMEEYLRTLIESTIYTLKK